MPHPSKPALRISSFIAALCLLASPAASLFLLPSAQAQAQHKGTVTGTVTDGANAALQGARVEIAPTPQVAISDSQGQFTVPDLPPGHYTIHISYLGFQPFSREIDLAEGATATVTASLAVGNANEQITVRPERQVGEAEALNRERVAANIVQVLPSEVINSLPNTNIADAVGRMPSVSLERDEGEGKYIQIRGTDPRLSNVTIDGIHVPSPENVRNVKLDVIPADLVESIELSKTLSANQDGDAIGGSVNLITRRATDLPYFTVQGLFGHTPISEGRNQTQYSSTFGRRFGAANKWGFMIGGSYDHNQRGINDIEPVPAINALPNGGSVAAPNTVDLRSYLYDRGRYGFAGGLDRKFGEFSSAYLRGLFAHFDDNGHDWIYSPTVGNFLSPTTTDATGNMGFTEVYRTPAQQIFSVQAGAHQEKGNFILNYGAALSQARSTGGFSSAGFDGPQNIAFGVDTRNPFTPKFPVLNGVNIYDPTQYTLSSFSLQDNHTFERDAVGDISLSRRYTVGQKFGTWEVGFKTWDAVKNELYNQDRYSADGSLQLSSVQSTFQNRDYYFNEYKYGPVSEYSRILQYFNSNRGAFTGGPNTSYNLQNDFHLDERIYAGFGMNTLNIGRVRLQTGLRVEGTQDSLQSNVLGTDSAGNLTVTPAHANNSYTYALPSVQAQYNFTSDTDVRAGYGIGIARPNFGDIAPYQIYDDTSKFAQAGNPNLKPTWAHNFDLLGEKYLKSVGLLQAGVFYKLFRNPIYTTQSVIATGPLAGYQQQQPTNGPSARLFGLEAAWEQHLRFLPGPLNGTGFAANYSYTSSRADVPGRTDHPSLQRDAPNNWNVDATYDKWGVSARMGLTHNDAYIWAYNYFNASGPVDGGLHGPNGDTYLYPHTQVDFQASYLVPHGRGLSAMFSLLNANNEVFGFYQGSEQFPIQREYYKPTYSVGVRWTLSREEMPGK